MNDSEIRARGKKREVRTRSGFLRKETHETFSESTSTVFNQVIPRNFMKGHKHPCFHPVSHDDPHCRFNFSLKPPYPGTLSSEVFGRRLRIRFVSQGVTRVLGFGFRG